jgi:hypothetical protein
MKTIRLETCAARLFLLPILLVACGQAHAIPAFARKYGLPCSACHEAWPKLNNFGQVFRDNGYQLGNDRDSPIYQNPSYWPIAMRVTPNWHFESQSNVAMDAVPGNGASGTVDGKLNTSGFDLSGIDILTGGTLANNISFLLVPSIEADSGTISFESAWVRLDDLLGSKLLNFKLGKFELDLPISEKRILTLSNIGGFYQLYHFLPPGDTNPTSIGDNQLGIELMGHSKNSYTRYALSLLSSTDGQLGLPAGRSYDGYAHISQGFLVPKIGMQRVGAFGFIGESPTFSLTTGGQPIPGGGRGAKSFYRVGAYGSLYIGPFDFTAIYQHSLDNAFLATGTAADQPLPTGARSPIWNTGTFEAHYTVTPQFMLIGRYELVRMARQALASNPSDFGNLNVFTFGYRYYPFMHSRAGLAWHQEVATEQQRLTSVTGQDQRSTSVFAGFDFAF